MDNCKICGAEDLFSAVTGEGVCSICQYKHLRGAKPTADVIAETRKRLGLADGELLKQDNGAEARRILGR